MSKPKPDEARRETLFRVIMITMFGGIMLLWFVVHIFEEPLQPDNYTNSYSTSPGGHSALVELLEEQGREVEHTSGSLVLPEWDGRATKTLVFLEPGPTYVERFQDEFETLFQTASTEQASIIITMPKRWYSEADEQTEGEVVLHENTYPKNRVESVLEATGFDLWFEIKRRPPMAVEWDDEFGNRVSVKHDIPLQVFDMKLSGELSTDFQVLARSEEGDPVVVRKVDPYGFEYGGVVLVSDPDVFTNRYIGRPGAATFAMNVVGLSPAGGAIVINEDLHGFSTDASVEYLASTPPGLWVSLSVILLLLLFGWRQATVLRPQSAEPQDRRARKYAIEGLARMMERARDHHTAYRRVLRRSKLVLGTGGVQVQTAGQTGMIQKGKTGRIAKMESGDSEERLVNAARRVAHQVRTGETEHTDWDY